MKITLDDIPVTPLDALQRLAAEAPVAKDAPTPKEQKSKTRRKHEQTLGALQVDKYLQAYGIEYSLKDKGGSRIYRLVQCLFDPAHGRNEASIIQGADGKITYQCFHQSCKGIRTWSDARALISGKDNLAQYCDGYDPAKAAKKEKSPRPSAESSEYLQPNDRGRMTFNPALFADHLITHFVPIVSDGVTFFRYHETFGVWKILPEAEILAKATELLAEHARTNRIKDSVSLSKSKIYVAPEDLLPDPMWLNLTNCMINVETLECRPHAPEFRSRVQLPLTYDPEASCPLWIETLNQIFLDDVSKAQVIQEFVGYCLYPRIIFPCAMFCIGKGGNGKGTVQYIIESLLGDENVSHISLQRMEEKFGPVELRDKLLNSCGETAEKPLEVTRFKEIAAADEIQAEVKYEKDVKYRPIAKHLISMNSFPGIKDKTDAFFRRIIVMEFKQQFEGDADDKDLKDKLRAELNGIFVWALEGLKRVIAKKEIVQPESVLNAKKRMRGWVNPVYNFVDEMCLLGEKCEVYPSKLFKVYRSWCDEGNTKATGKQRFYEQILTNFPVKRGRHKDDTKEHFEGICVVEDEQLPF